MGRNFILKDERGAACGYLTQGLGKVRCGIKGGEAGEITLVDERGAEVVHSLKRGEQGEWPDDGRALVAAYAQCGAKMFFTCERGKRAWERRRNRQLLDDMRRERAAKEEAPLPQETESSAPKLDKADIEETQPEAGASAQVEDETKNAHRGAGDVQESLSTRAQWPEPRWPVPPCMPGAVYVSGRWQD